jgi:hypothetical protein
LDSECFGGGEPEEVVGWGVRTTFESQRKSAYMLFYEKKIKEDLKCKVEEEESKELDIKYPHIQEIQKVREARDQERERKKKERVILENGRIEESKKEEEKMSDEKEEERKEIDGFEEEKSGKSSSVVVGREEGMGMSSEADDLENSHSLECDSITISRLQDNLFFDFQINQYYKTIPFYDVPIYIPERIYKAISIHTLP